MTLWHIRLCNFYLFTLLLFLLHWFNHFLQLPVFICNIHPEMSHVTAGVYEVRTWEIRAYTSYFKLCLHTSRRATILHWSSSVAESNGSLLPRLWLTSPAGWLPRTGISSGTLRSVIEYGIRIYCTPGKHNTTDKNSTSAVVHFQLLDILFNYCIWMLEKIFIATASFILKLTIYNWLTTL